MQNELLSVSRTSLKAETLHSSAYTLLGRKADVVGHDIVLSAVACTLDDLVEMSINNKVQSLISSGDMTVKNFIQRNKGFKGMNRSSMRHVKKTFLRSNPHFIQNCFNNVHEDYQKDLFNKTCDILVKQYKSQPRNES